MLLFVTAVARYMAKSRLTAAASETQDRPVVVIDAGHGGRDPGKIGINKAPEKDINLEIAKKLQYYLENDGVSVILTRENDAGLYHDSDGNKKHADMKKRCEIIGQSDADLVISIHQNSYHEENVRGAQVFYYKGSIRGQRLAELIQKRLNLVLEKENRRNIKANDQYYLLLHTRCPIVIAECGFLSNWEEAERLTSPDYQDQMAWTMYMGVMQYLNESG